MDLNSFMNDYANDIGGKYSEYDSNKSVIIVPLEHNRFQTIVGTTETGEKYANREGFEFSSKVCEFNQGLNLKSMLEANSNFCHAKFVIDEGFVKIEASTFKDSASDALLKEIIQEVANVADEWENKLTDQDVF